MGVRLTAYRRETSAGHGARGTGHVSLPVRPMPVRANPCPAFAAEELVGAAP